MFNTKAYLTAIVTALALVGSVGDCSAYGIGRGEGNFPNPHEKLCTTDLHFDVNIAPDAFSHIPFDPDMLSSELDLHTLLRLAVYASGAAYELCGALKQVQIRTCPVWLKTFLARNVTEKEILTTLA